MQKKNLEKSYARVHEQLRECFLLKFEIEIVDSSYWGILVGVLSQSFMDPSEALLDSMFPGTNF